jgi:drug/metabolite transporter (DMT)-like permease
MALSKPARADLALIVVTLIWGASFPIVKKSLAQSSPILFLTLRFWIATLVTLIFVPSAIRGLNWQVLRRSALLAVFLVAGFVFQTVGLRGTTPSKSAFLTSLAVLLVPVLGFVIFKRRPAWRTLAGVLIATLGIALLTLTNWDFRFRYGETLTLICAIVFALHILYLGRYAPISDFRQLALLQMGLGAILCTLLLPMLETGFIVWDTQFSLFLAFTSVLSTALAFYVQNRAQQLTTANRAALIFSLEPFFAAIFSYLIVGQSLSGKEWIGGSLVVAGILVSELRRG